MTPEEKRDEIISRVIAAGFGCFLAYWMGRFFFWLSPELKYTNILFTAILFLDVALIASGIKPKGITSWFRK